MAVLMIISRMLRVNTDDFVLTVVLGLILHFFGLIWKPLSSHQPDISSGLYIFGVLLFLMQPTIRTHSSGFWRLVWPNSLKMTFALALLQHVALVYLWDNCSSMFNWLPSSFWTFNCRLIVALLVIYCSMYRWLNQLRSDAKNAALMFDYSGPCPYCSELVNNQELEDNLLREQLNMDSLDSNIGDYMPEQFNYNDQMIVEYQD